MKNTMTYGGGNPGLGFGQAKKCGRVKYSNTVKTPPSYKSQHISVIVLNERY